MRVGEGGIASSGICGSYRGLFVVRFGAVYIALLLIRCIYFQALRGVRYVCFFFVVTRIIIVPVNGKRFISRA